MGKSQTGCPWTIFVYVRHHLSLPDKIKIIIILSHTQIICSKSESKILCWPHIIYPESESHPEVDLYCRSNIIDFESDSDPGFEFCHKFTLIYPELDSDPGSD